MRAGSYLQQYVSLIEEQYTDGSSVMLYFVDAPDAPVDFSDPQTHAVMDSAVVELQALPVTVDGSFVTWLEDMRQWKGGTLLQARFAFSCS